MSLRDAKLLSQPSNASYDVCVMKTTRALFLAALLSVPALVFLPAGAVAQTHYDIPNINFDMWCQETRHLPPQRCDKRLPGDESDYHAYVDTIDKYAIPYAKERRRRQDINRDILHYDPVDSKNQPGAPQ